MTNSGSPTSTTRIIATRLAAHVGISLESINDFDAFTSSVQNELLKRVVDLENSQLVYGNPTAGGLNGMVTNPGILTFTATGTTENFTDIAGAIATLRTGPALATPNLLLLHPDTWAGIRTKKDAYGRFLVSADPSQDQVEQVRGVEVLQSTQWTAGEGVLLDTNLMGRVAVRDKPDHADGLRRRRRRIRLHLQHRPMVRRRAV